MSAYKEFHRLMEQMPSCVTLTDADFAKYVRATNRRFKTHFDAKTTARHRVCSDIDEHVEKVNAAKNRSAIVTDMSNRLMRMLAIPEDEREPEDEDAIEALRLLGGNEAHASMAMPDLPREPRAGRAVASAATQANRLAKMMAGRVLSAYHQQSRKKDGSPLYVSYLGALLRHVEEHPDAMQLDQVQEALRLQ